MTNLHCFIIGEGSMPVECAKILVQNGFTIGMACSPTDDLQKWSNAQGIRFTSVFNEFSGYVIESGCDFLFSIANYRILPPQLLAVPRKFAINFHDGPLPKYAGVFATSWAIYNGEKLHGVTWHVMKDGIDTGEILIQKTVEVGPGETSESLNRKCWFAGLRCFRTLVQQLRDGTYCLIPQDMSKRTVYSFADWPPVEARESLARVMTFGPAGQRLLDRAARLKAKRVLAV